MLKIVGRNKEQIAFNSFYEAKNSEFVVVYGRRRVGKTFLIREYFKDKFDFSLTGLANANTNEQLINFHAALKKFSNKEFDFAKTWFDAFLQLASYLEQSKSKKKVVFIDELPWLDTPKSSFLSAFEHFWNNWASAREDILLIVCGSATSWIMNNVINNKGGLHNRITRKMFIAPFNLFECKEYLSTKNIVWNNYQIVESYMIFGGIPYYYSLLQKEMSLSQNIDRLFFSKNGELKQEFSNLYASLFKHAENHIKIVEVLGKKAKGLQRDEIIKESKIKNGGGLSKVLDELEQCGFISKYQAFDKTIRENIYQLTDFYTIFYLKFIKTNTYNDEAFWALSIDSPQRRAWSGFAFERVCMAHINQIKKKLGISGIQSKVASWRSRKNDNGAQIDLLIDRKDQVVNLCEMKFSTAELQIDKQMYLDLQNKASVFKTEVGTKKALYLTILTTYGIRRGEYADSIQNEIVMDDLFEKE